MRPALYSLILLGSIVLALDLHKLVKNIEQTKEKTVAESTAVETHGSNEKPEPAQNPHNHPQGHPDIEEALALYTAAIEKSPDQAKPYVDRANAYIANHDYIKAIADYDQAIKLEPENAAHFLRRGTLQFSAKKPEAAIADFTKSYELNPDQINPLAYRAFIYQNSKRHQEAADDYLLILKKDPTFTEVQFTLAECYKELGQIDKALEHIKLYIGDKNAERKKEAEALQKKWSEPTSE